MKIGEMKAQAITLMFPSFSVKLDESSDEDIIRAIYEMKSNPNFEGILEGSIGAINRAFSYIESRGYSTLRCVDIPSSKCEKRNGKIALPLCQDSFKVERVLFHTEERTFELDFNIENESILTKSKNGVYTVVYRMKIPRITRVTSDAYKPELPQGMAEYIPYYIVSDLAREENEELAKYALDHFEKGVKCIGEISAPCNQCFDIVYKWE